MDRGVVPLSAFVEVYIEVQDVNDNAPQTSEPVYYPSVMENSPKDVSIIQINAVDPDAKASDKLTYRITSGNPQGFFAINARTGKIATTVMAIHVTINCILRAKSPRYCIRGRMNMAASLRKALYHDKRNQLLYCYKSPHFAACSLSNQSSKRLNIKSSSLLYSLLSQRSQCVLFSK